MFARPTVSMLCALLLVVNSAAGAAALAQSLEIKLQDTSTDPSLAHMSIVLDQATIKAGRVTLRAENQSKTLVHEVIIARDDGAKELPMDAKHARVNESRVRRRCGYRGHRSTRVRRRGRSFAARRRRTAGRSRPR